MSIRASPTEHTHIEVILKFDRPFSREIDFSEDVIGSFDGRVVPHVRHGSYQIRTSDPLVVILVVETEVTMHERAEVIMRGGMGME